MSKKKETNRRFNFQFHEIQLDDGRATATLPSGIEQIQLLRVGDFTHKRYGEFKITHDTLRKLKENFDNDARRLKIPCDYFHDSGKIAAGWFQEVELREDDSELWVNMEWTPSARMKIEDKELRYISADFDFNYIDAETGVQFGPTLLGAGLTNRPHIKDMQIILQEKEATEINQMEEVMEIEKLLEMLSALTEDEKKMVLEKLGAVTPDVEMKEELESMKEGEAKLSETIAKLEAEKKELSEKVADSEKDAAFNVMLSEGKVCEAQREHFKTGNMVKFAESHVAVNLDEKGHGKGTEEKTVEKKPEMTAETASDELEEQAIKLMESEKISHGDALSQVLDLEENKKLVEICQS